jgi:hypothetical protein
MTVVQPIPDARADLRPPSLEGRFAPSALMMRKQQERIVEKQQRAIRKATAFLRLPC